MIHTRYDANGNRVTANGYVYTTGDGNLLLSDGTYWYTYDPEGNRTARFVDADASGTLTTGDTEVTQYAWDARNRLVKVTDYATYGGSPTQIVDYFYDLENRWIGEDIDRNGDGVVDHETRFVYDGNQIIFQFDKDGAGEVTSADLSHRYLWGPAVDQVLADEQVANVQTAGNVVWPLADNLDTVRDLAVSQNGITSVANHRVFDSYGNLVSQTNAAVDCVFGFTGFLTDKATGLDMSQTRPYDPRTGQWTQQDLIGLLGRDTNLYRYCGNSPTNFTDPSGLEWVLGREGGLRTRFFNGQWYHWVDTPPQPILPQMPILPSSPYNPRTDDPFDPDFDIEEALRSANNSARSAVQQMANWVKTELESLGNQCISTAKSYLIQFAQEARVSGTSSGTQYEWQIGPVKVRLSGTVTSNTAGEIAVNGVVTVSGTVQYPPASLLSVAVGISGSLNTGLKWDLTSGQITWTGAIFTLTARGGGRLGIDAPGWAKAYLEVGVYGTGSYNFNTGKFTPGGGIYGRWVAEGYWRTARPGGRARASGEVRWGLGIGPADTGD